MIILTFLLAILSFLFWKVFDHQNYFKKRNVKFLKSTPFLGALKDSTLKKCSLFDDLLKIYNNLELKDEPYFGMFLFHKPIILIKDPELIKRILVTDFQSFNSRRSESGVHDPIGYYHPFLCSYKIWKNVRSQISKFFTAAKLKSAFYLIEKLSDDLCGYIEHRLVNNKVELSIKFLTDLFFVDVISSVALGIEAHSLGNSGSEFYKVACSMWSNTLKRNFELISILIFPELGKIFKSSIMGKYADEFLCRVAPEIIAEREKSGHKRNDLIDILIDMKKDLKPEEPGHTVDHILISQIGAFLQAGYETSSTTTSFVIYEMSKNQEIQNRLRNEIKEVLLKNEGKLTYESLAFSFEMPYLHQVVSESMRLYQSVPAIDRKCTNPEGYSLEPFGNFHIPYGMQIQISIFAMARDEKYFPDPLKFDPERFNVENIDKVKSVNLSFGIGPHNCVGEKLALIQSKMDICRILKDYRIEMSDKTPKEIQFDKNAISLRSNEEIFLNFIKDSIF